MGGEKSRGGQKVDFSCFLVAKSSFSYDLVRNLDFGQNKFELFGQTTAFSSQFSQLRIHISEKAPRHRTRLILLYLVICGNPMLLAVTKGTDVDHLGDTGGHLEIHPLRNAASVRGQ